MAGIDMEEPANERNPSEHSRTRDVSRACARRPDAKTGPRNVRRRRGNYMHRKVRQGGEPKTS